MKWLAGILVATLVSLGIYGAIEAKPRVLEQQAITGLLCADEDMAVSIFDAWVSSGPETAREIYRVYNAVQSCIFLENASAFVLENISAGNGVYFDGAPVSIFMSLIVPDPSYTREAGDYIVTWALVEIVSNDTE